ncbi:MAG: hypothetical protein ACI82G_000610 [Bradymonadia bacterium]
MPEAVDVQFAYSGRASANAERALRSTLQPTDEREDSTPIVRRRLEAPAWLRWSPEYVPLGEHGPRIPAARRAAQRLLRAASFDAVLVNADPYAAMLVGAQAAAKARIPVVQDLRDPWSVCDLRRPRRPGIQRAVVDRMERHIVDSSARVILNTETTLAQYRSHYSDIDDARFACIRNHGDSALVGPMGSNTRDVGAPFVVLFLGNFRRFLHGNALLEGLASLKAAGHGPSTVRLAVTGQVTEETRAVAAALGVEDMLEERPFVPYTEIGRVMDSADLLIANIPSRMRIPAKFYDYALSRRPILALGPSDHAELRQLVSQLPGARFAHSEDGAAVGAAIAEAIAEGAATVVDRNSTGLDSATATASLARILDDAVAGYSATRS